MLLYQCTFKWPVGEAVNTLPSQGNIHGSKSHTGYQFIYYSDTTSEFLFGFVRKINNIPSSLYLKIYGIMDMKESNSMKEYKFNAIIQKNPEMNAGYIIFPYDIKKEFGKGRVKVHAIFDGIDYNGSIVNMGVKDKDNNICYIIGITQDIRNKMNKSFGDTIEVIIKKDSIRKLLISRTE